MTVAPVKMSPPTFEINVGGGTFTHETVPRDAIIGVEGGMGANGAKDVGGPGRAVLSSWQSNTLQQLLS